MADRKRHTPSLRFGCLFSLSATSKRRVRKNGMRTQQVHSLSFLLLILAACICSQGSPPVSLYEGMSVPPARSLSPEGP